MTDTVAYDSRYLEYFVHFNAAEYFESHEVLEDLWLEDTSSDRLFLQGLIQLAAAIHHLRNRNWTGAGKLLALGTAKLSRYPAHHWSLDLESFLAEVTRFIETSIGRPWGEIPAPTVALDVSSPESRLEGERRP